MKIKQFFPTSAMIWTKLILREYKMFLLYISYGSFDLHNLTYMRKIYLVNINIIQYMIDNIIQYDVDYRPKKLLILPPLGIVSVLR